MERRITNTMQRALDEAHREVFSKEVLLASLIEWKFKQNGVRLNASERERLRSASTEFCRTGDEGVIAKAVTRKRKVRISVTNRDLARFEKKMLKASTDGTITAITKLARSLESDARQWADEEVQWTTSIRLGFQERLGRTWRHPLHHYARLLRLAAYILELVVDRFNELGTLERSRLAHVLLLLHARAHMVAGEVEALIYAGFPDGAACSLANTT